MPNAIVTITGRRGPADDPMAVQRPDTDCVVTATISGDRYVNAIATLQFDGRQILGEPVTVFHAFCRYATGKPYRMWMNAAIDLPDAAQLGLTLQLPVHVSTTEQNLLKSCFLVYLWTEPTLLNPERQLDDVLYDEFIVDYTGQPGTQSFIYFPPAQFQRFDSPELQQLYDVRVLCRLTIQKENTKMQRYFTSLVIPGIRVSALTPNALRTWDAAKQRMLAAIRKSMRT